METLQGFRYLSPVGPIAFGFTLTSLVAEEFVRNNGKGSGHGSEFHFPTPLPVGSTTDLVIVPLPAGPIAGGGRKSICKMCEQEGMSVSGISDHFLIELRRHKSCVKKGPCKQLYWSLESKGGKVEIAPEWQVGENRYTLRAVGLTDGTCYILEQNLSW